MHIVLTSAFEVTFTETEKIIHTNGNLRINESITSLFYLLSILSKHSSAYDETRKKLTAEIKLAKQLHKRSIQDKIAANPQSLHHFADKLFSLKRE